MKKLSILFCLFFALHIWAQDKTYVHEAKAENTSLNGTVLNHPDLNNNPNAKIVFSHRYIPVGGVLNNNVNGLWYREADGRWLIYNENFTVSMEIGTLFTIFIADQAEVFTHVASVANQGTSNSNTLLDHPLLNGNNPGPFAVFSNYFNPNTIYNNNNYGFIFDTSIFNNRLIYNENFTPIPTDAAFKVLVIPPGGVPGVTTFEHLSSNSNTIGFSTTLDHPSLNNNPDAAFVYSHYFGSFGNPSNNNLNIITGALYDDVDGRWKIFTESLIPMPEGIAFDIVIADQEVLSTEDNTITTDVISYPNPVKNQFTIKSNSALDSISIYNVIGEEVANFKTNSNQFKVDASHFESGIYFLETKNENGTQTIKFIKN